MSYELNMFPALIATLEPLPRVFSLTYLIDNNTKS